MYEYVTHTADDEEPNCLECNSCTSGNGCFRCGPEYGWMGYVRTERIEVPNNG